MNLKPMKATTILLALAGLILPLTAQTPFIPYGPSQSQLESARSHQRLLDEIEKGHQRFQERQAADQRERIAREIERSRLDSHIQRERIIRGIEDVNRRLDSIRHERIIVPEYRPRWKP
jgi:hypothetical protein